MCLHYLFIFVLNKKNSELSEFIGKDIMTTREDLIDIFSILHDGTISEWRGDKRLLTLTVECLYLAERIDKSFDKFYIELYDIVKIELDPWTNSKEIPSIIKTEFTDIFKAELEILGANLKEENVVVTCSQFDKNFDYIGGNLTINCQKIKIFDQNKNELTIDQLGEICKNYWDELSNK